MYVRCQRIFMRINAFLFSGLKGNVDCSRFSHSKLFPMQKITTIISPIVSNLSPYRSESRFRLIHFLSFGERSQQQFNYVTIQNKRSHIRSQSSRFYFNDVQY